MFTLGNFFTKTLEWRPAWIAMSFLYYPITIHKQAIDKTLPLLDSLALSNTDEIILAHQILSLSYCETGNKEKAAEHLKALRAFSPSEDFRVFNPSPECQKWLVQESKSKKTKNIDAGLKLTDPRP
jgi:hypothetical protein